MCGIAGIFPSLPKSIEIEKMMDMCQKISHRGPDDWGVAIGSSKLIQKISQSSSRVVYFSSPHPIGLCNTRLSILDLSERGHQPMKNDGDDLWVAYNGEIYNFQDLRKNLESKGIRFRSQTDTEVILRLYEVEGVSGFRKLNGMFALAIWDARKQELILARDRFGIKPLYYSANSQFFAFASEIKSLLVAGISKELNSSALDRYLSFLYVPEPDTILKHVHKLPGGHWLKMKPGKGENPQIHQYWMLEPSNGEKYGSLNEVAENLLERLSAAVTRQTVSDVPIGAFLSGGLDSSAIVSLMLQEGCPPAYVHSVGFSKRDQAIEGGEDDLEYARRMVSLHNLRHHETILNPDIVNILPSLIFHLDEPIADPAMIPMYLMCQEAKSYTKVLLSGMGADEIFGGYRRHLIENLMVYFGYLPKQIRGAIHYGVEKYPSLGGYPFIPQMRRAKKFLRITKYSPEDRYIQACSWMDPERKSSLYSDGMKAELANSIAGAQHIHLLKDVSTKDPISKMLYLDTFLYLPGHNLSYTDKMSMAASVEVRVPFLDNDLVDFVFQLPSRFKIHRLKGKVVLKEALKKVLPPWVISRRKTGFASPIRSWLAHDLKPIVNDLLSPNRISNRGLFEPHAVSQMMAENERGIGDHSYSVWALLTLELWMQEFLDKGQP